MKAYEIMNHLEKYFPLNLQMDFDCCGLQIGSREKEVKKVYIALNADNETLQACIENNCQMLITHHPFLLEKKKTWIHLYIKENLLKELLNMALLFIAYIHV